MKNRILIVDDDEVLRRTLARSFSLQDDWEIFTAADADEALAKTDELRPDLIILDCDLGDEEKDGFWVLREVRRNPAFAQIPVAFLTGARIDADDKVRGFGLSADDYILKTVDPEEIHIRARAAIEKAQRSFRSA